MHLVGNTILLFLLLHFSGCDEYLEEYVGDYVNLDDYKFFPNLGDCYQIYHDEKVTPLSCRRRRDPLKQHCIELLPDRNNCVGIKTPSGETVEFRCVDTPEKLDWYSLNSKLTTCFPVRKQGREPTTVCQKDFEKYSIGITTPDNFTILLDSYFCVTAVTADEKKKNRYFVETFAFDPELRSCHKVYREDQEVFPYTCLNKDIHDACVHELTGKENCSGIITQNNETVILSCLDGSHKLEKSGCFKVYTSDNQVTTRCQEKLEERCVGFRTPSNLTVLLECTFCSRRNIKHFPYDIEQQGKYRSFVKTYIANEHRGLNTYLDKYKFRVFEQGDFVGPPNCGVEPVVHPYWLPNTNCYGLTLENNETVVLECTDEEKKEQRGCFKVASSSGDEGTRTCIRPLEEECVGIVTPKNVSISFGCYNEDKYCQKEKLIEAYNIEEMSDITARHIYPLLGSCHQIYGPRDEIIGDSCRRRASPEKYSCIEQLTENRNCLIIKFRSNETLEFVCGDKNESIISDDSIKNIGNCFNLRGPNGNVKKVCQKKIGDSSIGITTPSNYTMIFTNRKCTDTKMYKNLIEIQGYRKFVENFVFDPNVRTCYKVFTEDQELSPTSCLSDEIHESCIHQLKQQPNCFGITTQNGETIVLDCPEDNEDKDPRCFKIYTGEDQIMTSCQEQVEESCVGFRTPSNLTVLLECLKCRSINGETLPPYTNDYRKKFKGFVQKTLQRYATGEQVRYPPHFKIYKPHQGVTEFDCTGQVTNYEVDRLPGHENCLGVRTEALETVVLECPGKKPEKPGCFDVYTPNYGPDKKIVGREQKTSVCVKVIKERCIGLRLPNNWTLPLHCIEPMAGVCSTVNVRRNGPPPRM